MAVNQTLHDVSPSPGLVNYIYIFGGSCPLTEFCQVQNSLLCPNLAFSYIGSVIARHSSCGHQPNFAAFSRGHSLYLTGRPSRWASAHILVSHNLISLIRWRAPAVYRETAFADSIVVVVTFANDYVAWGEVCYPGLLCCYVCRCLNLHKVYRPPAHAHGFNGRFLTETWFGGLWPPPCPEVSL